MTRRPSTRARAGRTVVLLILLVGSLLFLGGLFVISEEAGTESDPAADSTALSEAAIEEALIDRLNEERTDRGLDPLSTDEGLAAVAHGHSQDMLDREYYAHESPDGADHMDRIERGDADCEYAGENIAQTWYDTPFQDDSDTSEHTSAEDVAAGLIEQWLNSPEHRENMLLPDWGRTGVGIAVSDEGKVFATQLFCP